MFAAVDFSTRKVRSQWRFIRFAKEIYQSKDLVEYMSVVCVTNLNTTPKSMTLHDFDHKFVPHFFVNNEVSSDN